MLQIIHAFRAEIWKLLIFQGIPNQFIGIQIGRICVRKVILQDGREITTEITKKQKEILESMGIKPEHVATFLKS